MSGFINIAPNASGGRAGIFIVLFFAFFPSCSDCLSARSFGAHSNTTHHHECLINVAHHGIPFSRSVDACPYGAEIKNRSGEG